MVPTVGHAEWVSGFHLQGLSGDVNCVLDWQGKVVAGGEFTFAGVVSARNVAVYANGTWATLGDGLPNEVLDLVEGGGGLLALMRERTEKSVWLLKVMSWDGIEWTQLGPDFAATRAPIAWYHGTVHLGAYRLQDDTWAEAIPTDGTIKGLNVLGDDLIASGSFLNAGGTPASCIVAWNDGIFSPLGTGLPEVPQVVIVSDGNLHVLIGYAEYSYMLSCEVMTWSGSDWTVSPPFGQLWAGFQGIAVYEGNVYVFGWYGAYIDSPHPSCMAYFDGTGWSGLTYLGFLTFTDFCLHADRLIAVGSFRTVDDVVSSGAIAFDGEQWHGMFIHGDGVQADLRHLKVLQGDLVTYRPAPGCGPYDPYYEIILWDNTDWNTYAYFSQGHPGWILSDGNSLALASVGPFLGPNLYLYYGPSYAIPVADTPADPTLYHDGALYAPGPTLYRYADAEWTVLTTSANGDIETLAHWNGALVASGEFTTIDGQDLTHIGTYEDGVWTPLGAGLDAPARLLAGWSDKLAAYGSFTMAGGQPAAGLAAWDGHDWIPLCSSPVAGSIHALCGYAGDLYVGGEFAHIDGVAAANVARFDGSAWHPLDAGTDGPVHAMARKDWRLHMVGDFTAAGGRASHHVAAWHEPTVANELKYFRAERDLEGIHLSWMLALHRPEMVYVLRRQVVPGGGWVELPVPCSETAEMTFYDAYAGPENLVYDLLVRGSSHDIVLGQAAAPAGMPGAEIATLHAPVPNPFNPSTDISFSLARPAHVRLSIHDARGQKVRVLKRGGFSVGRHVVDWDGRDDAGQRLPSGVYFACLFAEDRISATKLVLTR